MVFTAWHAYAAGIYSDESVENTTAETFLRGYRITDSNRAVTFKTIVPGWYSGRIIHIDVDSNALFVRTQLFFDQTLINALTTSVSPYRSRGWPDTIKPEDSIYSSSTQLTLAVMLRP